MRGAVGVAMLLAAVADASPRDVGAGRAHFAAGTTYYREHRFFEAVSEFQEAYRLSGANDLLYNIAACYEALDDPGRATVYYRRYLAARAGAPERAEIEASLYRMSERVGKLIIEAPARVELFVDGIPIEIAPPAPLPVTAGAHRVEARRAGKPVAAADVTVAGGLSVPVRLTELAALSVDEKQEPRRRWLWPVVGVAAALVVAAVVLTAVLVRPADFSARGRDLCTGQSGCAVIDLAELLR
jgi:hypothetical protein